MSPQAESLLSQVAQWSTTLAPEAGYYWRRHAPRYRHMVEIVEQLGAAARFNAILDVGMSFETLLLGDLFPAARVDCLGLQEDQRFRPRRDFTFHRYDLNDVAAGTMPPGSGRAYDLIVMMEVIEHLIVPPATVLRFLAGCLRDGGHLLVTTPNAAWLKNRLKMMQGKNPFELLRDDRGNMGHIREYTKPELEQAIAAAGLRCVQFDRAGLYRFNNSKDNFYSAAADLLHPSLRRTLVAVCRK